jgi:hypothetical protein
MSFENEDIYSREVNKYGKGANREITSGEFKNQM